jgi:ParB family transcriptional regulator, chromosome partitioning protein
MNKNTKRVALGRGLSALIPSESPESEGSQGTQTVDIHAIRPNPFQPRTEFDQEEINGLAKSIEAQGLLQPVIVRKKVDGYEIVSGERRIRAMKQLGWDRAPCVIRETVSDREMLELALVENIQRENLTEIEQAVAYQRLLLECQISHEKLSERVGKSRSTITNTLRLLKLPQPVQNMIKSRSLSPGHARALLTVDDAAEQTMLAKRIVDDGLSVRSVEDAARQTKGRTRAAPRKPRTSTPSPALDPDIQQQLDNLQYRFGTAVRLNGNANRGKIEIHFSSAEDLNRVVDLLLGTG